MNDRTSRRSFVALATGALASIAAGLGRAFGQSAVRKSDPHFDAAARDAPPDDAATTIYTFDRQGRLLRVSEPASAVASTFNYRDV